MDLQSTPGAARRPDIHRAFEHLASGAQPGPSEDPITAMRAFVDRYGDVDARGPLSAKAVLPVNVGEAPAEWIVPHQARGCARIVLLHGGGWVAGGLESHRPMAAVLAELSGLPVLLLGYRLAPEHPFPAGFEDCRAALAWAWRNGPNGVEAADQVFLVGDSAGGNLAAAVCVDAIASGGPLPSRLVLMSPALDGSANPARGPEAAANGDQASLEAMMSLYLPSRDQIDNPRVSPLMAAPDILARFPPTLIQASNAEFLVWDAGEFARRLMQGGVRVTLSIWPAMPHVWQAFLSLLPEAREALSEAAGFLAAQAPAS